MKIKLVFHSVRNTTISARALVSHEADDSRIETVVKENNRAEIGQSNTATITLHLVKRSNYIPIFIISLNKWKPKVFKKYLRNLI